MVNAYILYRQSQSGKGLSQKQITEAYHKQKNLPKKEPFVKITKEQFGKNVERVAKREIIKMEIDEINKKIVECKKREEDAKKVMNNCKREQMDLKNAKARKTRTDKDYKPKKRVRKAKV